MLRTRFVFVGGLVLVAGITPAQSVAPIPPAVTPSPAAPSRPRPCVAPVYRDFDFWIGQWDVMGADGAFAGTNRITPIDGGCALHESWSSGVGGYTGQSLNSVGLDGKWHQTWVDRSGLRLEISGGLVGSSMVLEGETQAAGAGRPAARNRITWTPQSPNLVRQHWETSTDQGRTWTTAFDGAYHKIPDPAAAPSFLTRLQGAWIGKGQLAKRDTHVELRLEPMLGRPLFHLNWRNVVLSEPRNLFEGVAIYEETGASEFTATWWDSQGARHAIKATVSDSVMTSYWGDAGRTTYSLLESGELEVVDSTKKADGSWVDFGRATLRRK